MHYDRIFLCRVEVCGQSVEACNPVASLCLEAPWLCLAQPQPCIVVPVGCHYQCGLGLPGRNRDVVHLVWYRHRRAMYHDVSALAGNAHTREFLKWLSDHCRFKCLHVEPVKAYAVAVLRCVIETFVSSRPFHVLDACRIVGSHGCHLQCPCIHEIEMIVKHIWCLSLRNPVPYAAECLGACRERHEVPATTV